MGEFNSDDHYIYYCGQESLTRNDVAAIVNKRVWNAVLGCSLKNDRMISVRFQGKPFNTTVIQVYVPTTNAKEAEVERFCEDLQDLALMHKKVILFLKGMECKSRESRDTWSNRKIWPWSTKWSRAETNKTLPRECTGHSKQHNWWNHLEITAWSSCGCRWPLTIWPIDHWPDGQYWNQIDYILCSQRWRNSIQSAKTRPGSDCGSDHQLLIAKFGLKLKKVGKTTRPFAAAAAAKLPQSCLTLCDPTDGSPPGSPIPGILQARTLEWVAIFFSNAWKWKVKAKTLSRVWLLATSWTAAYQVPPSMGFSRQEYWSGSPLPSPTRPFRYELNQIPYYYTVEVINRFGD